MISIVCGCRNSAKAEHSDSQSQFELAVALFRGDWGLAKDEVQAAKWLRKAAEQGHALAQNDLGLCFQNRRGVTTNAVKAVRWWRKAAELNNADAQCSLGFCYLKSGKPSACCKPRRKRIITNRD